MQYHTPNCRINYVTTQMSESHLAFTCLYWLIVSSVRLYRPIRYLKISSNILKTNTKHINCSYCHIHVCNRYEISKDNRISGVGLYTESYNIKRLQVDRNGMSASLFLGNNVKTSCELRILSWVFWVKVYSHRIKAEAKAKKVTEM